MNGTGENEKTEHTKNKWQSVPIKSGKRGNNESPTLHQKKKQIVIHPNRFDILSDDDDDLQKTCTDNNIAVNEEEDRNIPKPPPLIIPGVYNISEMINTISSVIDKKDFSYKSLKDGQIRLMITNIDSYRKIVKQLDSSNVSFHTYQLKQDRPYRVVLKGIHFSTSLEEINKNISSLGHKVRNVFNVKSRITKQPLSMFFVDLEPNANNKDIYELKHLNNAIIKVEPPRQTNDIVQCYRCQEFGHTKTYCKKPYKCVKCNSMHPTTLCTKPSDTLPTCVHCLQNHTANYKGCSVYQQLVRNKPVLTNIRKEKKNIEQQNFNSLSNGLSQLNYANNETINSAEQSYSNVLKGTVRNEQNTMKKIELLLEKQLELTNTLLNTLSLLINKLCK
uniref:Nucleic-acid-binding protein from transposon X-element n=1 Tax=Ceratitis capitata TaxID=7213 RepID=W8C1S6_CERCA